MADAITSKPTLMAEIAIGSAARTVARMPGLLADVAPVQRARLAWPGA